MGSSEVLTSFLVSVQAVALCSRESDVCAVGFVKPMWTIESTY